MQVIHYIFFILFLQTYFIFGNLISVFILFLYSIFNIIKKGKINKIIVILFIPYLYWFFNIFIFNPEQLLYLEFYRYDGKLIVIWTIFILFIASIHYKNKNQYIKNLKQFLMFLWIISICGFIPFLNFSLFNSHNANAGFLGSVLILTFLILINYNNLFKFNKLILFIVFIYIAYLFFSQYSRAFTVGFILSILYIFFKNIENINLKNIIIFLIILIIILLTMIFSSNIIERFKSILKGDLDYNVITRFALWNLAYKLWKKNILFGIGIGSFNDIAISQVYHEFITSKYFFGEQHSHNIILQLLVEQGIIGLFLFFISFFFIWKYLLKKENLTKSKIHQLNIDIYKSLFIYLFIASQFGLNFFTPSTSIIFYTLLANMLNFKDNRS